VHDDRTVHVFQLPLGTDNRFVQDDILKEIAEREKLGAYRGQSGAPEAQAEPEDENGVERHVGNGHDDHRDHYPLDLPFAQQYPREHVPHDEEEESGEDVTVEFEGAYEVQISRTEHAHNFLVEDVSEQEDERGDRDGHDEGRFRGPIENHVVFTADGSRNQ
jgi:hypothetical protein